MYVYKQEKPLLFTEDGQVMFLKIRDRVRFLLKEAGAFTMESAIKDCTGSTWSMLACVDRLVELGEIRELTTQGTVPGEYRVFTWAKR